MIILHGRSRFFRSRRLSHYAPVVAFMLATVFIALSVYGLITRCGMPENDGMRAEKKDGNTDEVGTPLRILLEASRRYDSPSVRLKRAIASRKDGGSFDLCPAMIRGEIWVRDSVSRSGSKKTVFLAKWRRGRNHKKAERYEQVVVKRNDFIFDEHLEDHILAELDNSKDGFVQRVEFFLSLSNALERMGVSPAELDVTFAVADTNRDGKLGQDELVVAAQIVIDRYNLLLPPEALLFSEHPTSDVFPRYHGHCNTSYVVEFLPVHSLQLMKNRPWPERAKLAAGLLDWAKRATSLGFYACDVILGNFGQDTEGKIKMNDLDQVHTAEDVRRWSSLPCQVSRKGVGECFNDGHCRPSCKADGTCAIMPPHHNTKEVCKRLFARKSFLAKAPTQQFAKLTSTCAHHSSPKSAMKAAMELHALLLIESREVGAIKPPSFELVTKATPTKVPEAATTVLKH